MQQSVESVGFRLSSEQFERFRRFVHQKSGLALRAEKQQLVCSRLARRLRELGIASFDEYFELVTQHQAAELEHMLNALTTNKTSFFREAHHFDELRARVVEPYAAAQKRDKLRIWSAGCSTGEEPYSILMTVLDALPGWESEDVRLLASDLDSEVLTSAERGVYAQERTEGLEPALCERWLIEGTGAMAGQLRVRRALRERVVFRRINFVEPSWPIRTSFDAIFCRNALIYFDAETQKKIVSRLLSFLKVGGYLFLGHSESMAGVRPELRSLGRTTYRFTGDEST
ncbi:MAG: methyltransferase protein [Myxococcaceae bacterium]|nr:methyltransferase protein [Myxococcaceae bacterium]